MSDDPNKRFIVRKLSHVPGNRVQTRPVAEQLEQLMNELSEKDYVVRDLRYESDGTKDQALVVFEKVTILRPEVARRRQ